MTCDTVCIAPWDRDGKTRPADHCRSGAAPRVIGNSNIIWGYWSEGPYPQRVPSDQLFQGPMRGANHAVRS